MSCNTGRNIVKHKTTLKIIFKILFGKTTTTKKKHKIKIVGELNRCMCICTQQSK